jgi:hypothetical protein
MSATFPLQLKCMVRAKRKQPLNCLCTHRLSPRTSDMRLGAEEGRDGRGVGSMQRNDLITGVTALQREIRRHA